MQQAKIASVLTLALFRTRPPFCAQGAPPPCAVSDAPHVPPAAASLRGRRLSVPSRRAYASPARTPAFYFSPIRGAFERGLGVGLFVVVAQIATAVGFARAWAGSVRHPSLAGRLTEPLERTDVPDEGDRHGGGGDEAVKDVERHSDNEER